MRQTTCKKFLKLGSIFEQRPRQVERTSIHNNFQRTIQKKRVAHIPNQIAIVFIREGASTESNNTANPLLQVLQGFSFHSAKLEFSLMLEDFANRLAVRLFYFLIQVDELPS